MTPEVRIESKQRVLQKMRVAYAQMTPVDYVMRNMDLDIIEEYMAQMLLYRLHSHVLAEDLGTREYEVKFDSPASWWQYFKLTFALYFPRWFLRRRPVRYRTTVKKVIGHGYRGYPNAPIALPPDKMGDAVVFETFELKRDE